VCQALFAALRGGPLRLWILSEDSGLARLPWEYLCVPQSLLDQAGLSAEDLGWPAATPPFLALHPKVSLVRRGTRALHPATIAAIGALRLLVVSANPNCAHWPDAAVYLDLEAIHTELRGVPASHLQIETLTGATRSALEARPKSGVVGPMSNYVSGPQLDLEAKYRGMDELVQYAREKAFREDVSSYRPIPSCLVGSCTRNQRRSSRATMSLRISEVPAPIS